MPINLLQRKKPVKIKKEKLSEKIELHIPVKEKISKAKKPVPQAKVKPEKPKVVLPSKELLPEVNLIKSFKIYLLKKRLTFSALFAIIFIGVFGGISVYFVFFYKPEAKIAVNVNKPAVNLNLPISPPPVIAPSPVIEPPKQYCGDAICQVNENYNTCPNDCPAPPSPPLTPPSPPQPLPDTELAPLRGSLIKFSGEEDIYLIELNGELRKVDLNSVFFANGQKISEVSPNLIYTIADRFKNIRKGKAVIGKVEWDPRVLNPQEIEPYLK